MKHDAEMTFGEHLEELRRRVIFALLGLAVTSLFCGVFYQSLLSALMQPYLQATAALAHPETPHAAKAPGSNTAGAPAAASPAPSGPAWQPRLILGSPLMGYTTILLVCILCGVILASPWILYQIWAFVSVGLHPHERRFVHLYGPISFLLFVAGAALFYFFLLPVGLQALLSPTSSLLVNGVPIIDPSLFLNDYFKFVAVLTLVFGIVFQTPLIVMFLAATGIVPLSSLARQQKVVILIMTIAAAILTPTVDPVSMIAMALPLIGLYELGLLLAWLSQRRQGRPARAEPRP